MQTSACHNCGVTGPEKPPGIDGDGDGADGGGGGDRRFGSLLDL